LNSEYKKTCLEALSIEKERDAHWEFSDKYKFFDNYLKIILDKKKDIEKQVKNLCLEPKISNDFSIEEKFKKLEII